MTTSIPGTKRTEAYGGCEVHPAAELFPLLEGDDFSVLVEDIRTNGLVESIWRTPDGRILDGRNRYRACMAAGVEPTYQVHDGDPWTFAVSRNLHRRHLTGPQRAMIAARIAERAHGSNRYSTKTAGREELSIGDSSLPAETQQQNVPSQREAAALLNTSTTSVHRARAVITKGTAALHVGRSAQTIRDWETGTNEPRLVLLRKLAALYKVTAAELLDAATPVAERTDLA